MKTVPHESLLSVQEVLNGPHTRVRVDTPVMPSAPPMVAPQGKSKKKAAVMRQMGLGNFYKGQSVPSMHSRSRLLPHHLCV